MKIIEWNVGYGSNPNEIYKTLKEYLDGSFIVTLLEVIPSSFEKYRELFGSNAHLEYSLDYRKPGKYDGKGRKLGILFITSLDINVEEAGVFNRTLLPDRTLFARLRIRNKILKVATLHSITGCSHKKAKSLNFCSFAEEIDNFKPDILTMDANEPAVDHYDIKQMEFFNNGNGAKILFHSLENLGLVDSYLQSYNKDNFELGKPLAVSHKINNKTDVRYDFIFVNKGLEVNSCSYDYDKAVQATADHAVVVVQIDMFE